MRDAGGVLAVDLDETEVDERLAASVPGLKPGPYTRLSVTDTGTGLTPEVRERIFDPFFTTKRPGEGSGMGLPVVDGIVKDYGGAIQVSSEAGQGSRFTVYLPRISQPGQAGPAAPEKLPGGAERVLLIDDEIVQVRSIKAMLQRLGYDVVAMTDGPSALETFRAHPQAFDIVITDQTMPQLTGAKVAEAILELRPDLPIILCTGFSETVDARGARIRGIREFLMKPYSIREMAEAIRRALAGAPPQR
jgi:CheY-like chemotaxis protein